MAERKLPTARTLEALRKLDYPAQVVEKWLPVKRGGRMEPYGVRKDLFGCVDIVALDGQMGVLGIQACAGASIAARVTKAMAEPLLTAWLAAGNRFQVWGWREVWVTGKSGSTKRRQWMPRVVNIFLLDGILWSSDSDEAHVAPTTQPLAEQPALQFEEEKTDV